MVEAAGVAAAVAATAAAADVGSDGRVKKRLTRREPQSNTLGASQVRCGSLRLV
jgi:hypothetical protein